MVPETKYAKSGDLHIAYQFVGDGPVDLVYLRNWISHIEFFWHVPTTERLLNRLASFSRLIIFDHRGIGLSDPIPLDRPPSLEDRTDDLLAVLDAAGSTRAAILGSALAGPVAAVFAAAHPDRTSALILQDTAARFVRADDYSVGEEPDRIPAREAKISDVWGTPRIWEAMGEPPPADAQLQAVFQAYNRASMSPGTAATMWRNAIETDVRTVLPAIRVPTLVLHERGRPAMMWSKYLADRIPQAKLVVTPESGGPSRISPGPDALDEIQEFVTGVRPQAEADRILATLLFTDIVRSTERAAAMGDRRWSDLLTRHNDVVEDYLPRFDGKKVDSSGDGILATFDGPARAIRCACAIRDAVKGVGLDIRAGLHTGEIEIGTDDIRGIAIHIGARISAMAGTGEVLVSSTVKDLVVGSGIEFEDRGSHVLKGVPDEWRVFAVKD